MRLGEQLIKNGSLKPHQLHAALCVQKKYPFRLGKILHQLGMIGKGALLKAILMQKFSGYFSRSHTPPVLNYVARGELLLEQLNRKNQDIKCEIKSGNPQHPRQYRGEWCSYKTKHLGKVIDKDDVVARNLETHNF